jgi:hypothetical protein
MLDKAIEELSGQFIARVRSLAIDSPVFTPNESVHSLTILDLFFNSAQYPGDRDEYALDIIRASAYTGIVCYKILTLANFNVKLTFTTQKGDAAPSVHLKAERSDEHEGYTLSIDITKVLTKTIFSKEVHTYAKDAPFPQGLKNRKLWFTCLGIISTLHQEYEIKGTYNKEDITLHIANFCRHVSEEYSVFYLTYLPGKEHIFSPRMFFPDLIFPPPGTNESTWFQYALSHLKGLVTNKDITQDQLAEFAGYLIESSNIQHVALAACILAAFQSSNEKLIINEFLHSFPLVTFHLLPSIEAFINLLGIQFSLDEIKKYSERTDSTLTEGNPETQENSRPQYETQQRIIRYLEGAGLFPLLYCPHPEVMTDKRFSLYFEIAMKGYISEAYVLGCSILNCYEIPPGILLQHIFISLEYGKTDEINAHMSSIPAGLSQKEHWAFEALALLLDIHNEENTEKVLALLEAASPEVSFPGQNKIKKILFTALTKKVHEEEHINRMLEYIERHPDALTLEGLHSIKMRFPEKKLHYPPSLRKAYWSQYRFFK